MIVLAIAASIWINTRLLAITSAMPNLLANDALDLDLLTFLSFFFAMLGNMTEF
jgi:hypothetical protein